MPLFSKSPYDGDELLPQEPGGPLDYEALRRQKLESERAGAIIEEFMDEEPEELEEPEQRALTVSFPDDENLTATTSHYLLGEPNAPILMNAQISLPPDMDIKVFGERLGAVVESATREGLAEAIENDWDEFVYLPLSYFTSKEKKRKGLMKPNTPLYGTGKLVRQMRPGGWATDVSWEGNTLVVDFGPTQADDLDPSDKDKNQFFGTPGVGPHHETKIPRRFTYIGPNLQRELTQIMNDWVSTASNQSTAVTVYDSRSMWS